MNKRLASQRTRSEAGLDYVIHSIHLNTPFGSKLMKEMRPYFPGEEDRLEEEYARLQKILSLAKNDTRTSDLLQQAFMEVKDVRFTITRSGGNALSVVELFEVKSLLLRMETVRKLLAKTPCEVPEEYLPADVEELLDILDPRGDRMDTFYIYDEFSEELLALRKEKRELEIGIRREQKKLRDIVKEKYGVELTPKFDCLVSKANATYLRMIREIPELVQEDEDFVSVTFALKGTAETEEQAGKMEELGVRIDEAELAIREKLSAEIARFEAHLLDNCTRMGLLDIALSKALYAVERELVVPEILRNHEVRIFEGRHLQVEDMVRARQKTYCPVSIHLRDGVTCITGANMGGKTVSLKLVGLMCLLVQYAFFVPAKSASVGLSNFMQILIGDNQSLERGLSSFGSEMEELKEILDNSKDRSLLLIDEIASGTNPVEGLALTRSLVDYLIGRPYITLMTTHFDSVADAAGVVNMQVVGLAGADMEKLDKEIRYASRKERIGIIANHMDYRLSLITEGNQIPKDALNIAKILGIDREIIENAKKYLRKEGKDEE